MRFLFRKGGGGRNASNFGRDRGFVEDKKLIERNKHFP